MINYEEKVDSIMNTLHELTEAVKVDGYGTNVEIMTLAVNCFLIGVATGSNDTTLIENVMTALEFETMLNE